MKSFLLLPVVVIFLSGCGTLSHKVSIADAVPPPTQYVTDKTGPDDYPGFMAAEGNIYSCRYGIHHQSREDFTPPKEQIFASLLAKHLPEVVKHNVVLHRFDVYVNNRPAALNTASFAIGGIIGGTIAAIGDVNNKVFAFKNIIIDSDPTNITSKPTENAVGCDNEGEGEYYASQISGTVIVTWLKFDIDSKPYHFKTYHQLQSDFSLGIQSAIQLTIEGIASQVALR